METQALQKVDTGGGMSLKQVSDRVNLVHQILDKVMKKGTHYGTVPGCGSKMVLLKPGADVLAMTFRLVPQFAVERTELPNDHREYDVTCSMYGPDGALLGQGVGSGSTMEKKYRYRKDGAGNRIENEDIADVYNTVLKMAKKRAHIDATLTVTGAADIFTQDLIDDAATQAPIAMPKAKNAPAAQSEGVTVITGVVEAVSVKESKPDAKKQWRKWGVKIGDDWYGTFDTDLGFAAESMKGKEAVVGYVVDGKGYNTIQSILPADVAPNTAGAATDEQLPFEDK